MSAKNIFNILFTTVISVLIILSGISTAQVRSYGELIDIKLNKMDNQLEVQIVLDKLISYSSFSLLNPNRLVIDFSKVDRFSHSPHIEINAFGVNKIRTALYQPEVTRVVFDLADKSPSYETMENEDGLTIIFWYEKEDIIREEEVSPPPEKEEAVQKKEEAEEKEETVEEVLPKLLEEIDEVIKEDEGMTLTLGLSGGAYFFHDSDLQDVYDKTSGFIAANTIFSAFLKNDNYIGASLTLKYIFDIGRNPSSGEKAELEIIPISFSVLYLRKFGRFFPYLGAGLDYYNYKENFPDASDNSSITGATWGANFQVGSFIKLNSSLILVLYFRYHNARLKESHLDLNVGGNEYGLAVAYRFKI